MTKGHKKDSRCYECSHTYESLNKYFDISLLITKRNERLKKEKEDEEARILKEQEIKAEEERLRKIEERKIAEKTRKIKIIADKIAIVAVIVLVLSYSSYYLVARIIQPNIQKNIQKMNDYNTGMNKCDNGDYIDGIELLEKCADYKDAKDLVKFYSYNYAKELYENQNYGKASAYFLRSKGYEDADALYLDSMYNHANECLNNDMHLTAVTVFEKIKDYKDSNEKIDEAKYLYIKKHPSLNNNYTYSFLIDLKNTNYKDSQKLYDELTKLKAEVFAINDDEDSNINKSSISNNGKFVFTLQ